MSTIITDKTSTTTKGFHTVNDVLKHAQTMLENVPNDAVVLIDAFPRALKELLPYIEKLRSEESRIKVFVQVYEKITIHNITSLVISKQDKEKIQDKWGGEQLNIAVDGKEMLAALFNNDMDEVREATYSNGRYLSSVFFAGLLNEHKLLKFINRAKKDYLNATKRWQKKNAPVSASP